MSAKCYSWYARMVAHLSGLDAIRTTRVEPRSASHRTVPIEKLSSDELHAEARRALRELHER